MNKRQNGNIPEHIVSEFDEEFHNEMDELWQLTGSAAPDVQNISPIEVENALHSLNTRLEIDGDYTPTGDRIAGWIQHYSRVLVAAVALLTLTTFFIFVPRTAVVPYGEMATLELPDGSVIELNSGSTVRYSRFYRFTNRTVELNGEAAFIVADHGHPFIVKANGVTVEVTGTQFNVRSWHNDPSRETIVTVAEGEVLFYLMHNRNQTVTLSAGEASRWNPQLEQPSEPESSLFEDAAAWREERFVFRNQALGSILHDLERRYNTTIELEAPGIENSPLTAYYSQQVLLESVLDDICTVKGLRYTKTTTGYRIYR
jgi:transmembrane sensor